MPTIVSGETNNVVKKTPKAGILKKIRILDKRFSQRSGIGRDTDLPNYPTSV